MEEEPGTRDPKIDRGKCPRCKKNNIEIKTILLRHEGEERIRDKIVRLCRLCLKWAPPTPGFTIVNLN